MSRDLEAYLHHGTGTAGPFLTESVPVRESVMPWQAAGLNWTASGYGVRIPSRYMVKYLGRWRRVYVARFSNAGTCYIGRNLITGIVVQVLP